VARARAGVAITLSVLNKPQPHRSDDQTPGVIIVTVHVFTNTWLFTLIHNFVGTQRYHSQTGCHVDHQALHIFALRRIFFFSGAIFRSGPAPPPYRGFTITLRHTTLGRTPLDGWSDRRNDLYLPNTQHSQETNNHAPSGIQTHNPNKQAAADPRLRPRGHRERPTEEILNTVMFKVTVFREVDGFGAIGVEGNVKRCSVWNVRYSWNHTESLCGRRWRVSSWEWRWVGQLIGS
jgi:hypothetical protein